MPVFTYCTVPYCTVLCCSAVKPDSSLATLTAQVTDAWRAVRASQKEAAEAAEGAAILAAKQARAAGDSAATVGSVAGGVAGGGAAAGSAPAGKAGRKGRGVLSDRGEWVALDPKADAAKVTAAEAANSGKLTRITVANIADLYYAKVCAL